MTAALVWKGTREADEFVFDNDDTVDVVFSGRGADYISDLPGSLLWSADVFHGGRGNDTLVSLDGADSLYGDRGDDVIDLTNGSFTQIPGGMYDPDAQTRGFNPMVDGGSGYDLLILRITGDYTMEHSDDITLIHTENDGLITVANVEETLFL